MPFPIGSHNLRKWQNYIVKHPKPWKQCIKEVFNSMTAGTLKWDPAKVDTYTPIFHHAPRVRTCTRLPLERTEACMCGLRHCNKRSCRDPQGLRKVSYLEQVAKGVVGKCPFCSALLKNDNTFTCHLQLIHGYRAPQSTFADNGGVCLACQRCYHTRPRLIAHLTGKKGVSVCFRSLVVSGMVGYSDKDVQKFDG